jgi:hypothetical protein
MRLFILSTTSKPTAAAVRLSLAEACGRFKQASAGRRLVSGVSAAAFAQNGYKIL